MKKAINKKKVDIYRTNKLTNGLIAKAFMRTQEGKNTLIMVKEK